MKAASRAPGPRGAAPAAGPTRPRPPGAGRAARGRAGVLAALALAASAGCVRVPPPDLSRDPDALLAQVREAQALARTVRGSARVGVAHPGTSGTLDAWAAAEKPDRVRVELLDFFGNPASVLVAAAGRFSLYDARAGVLYRGEATPENLARLLPLPLGARDLTTLLCGSAPLLEGAPVAAEPDGGAMRLELAGADGRQLLWVGEGAAVRAARLEPAAGSRARGWSAEFDVFRRRAGARVPTDSELRAPEGRVTLHWKEDLEVNVGVDPATFRMDAPRGARVVDLGAGDVMPEVSLPLRAAPRP